MTQKRQEEYYLGQYNLEATLHNDALILLQEADLLSKSENYDDLIEAANIIFQVEEILSGISMIDVANLQRKIRLIVERINIYS